MLVRGFFGACQRNSLPGTLELVLGHMDEGQRIEIAMRYATEWYTYHASQRMTAVRFYLAIVGALLIAGVQARASHPDWVFAIALFGAMVSFVFWVLDVRNTELVACGRVALDQLEKELGLGIRADDRERHHLGEVSCIARWTGGTNGRRFSGLWRFQCWLRLLYGAVFVVAIALAIGLVVNDVRFLGGNRAAATVKESREKSGLRVGGASVHGTPQERDPSSLKQRK